MTGPSMKTTLLILAVVAGCAGEGEIPLVVDQAKVVAPPARAEELIDAVMSDWGMEVRPVVWWYASDVDACPSGRSWKDRWGRCVRGESALGVIVVSTQDKAPDAPVPLHQTALIHEIAHCASDERGEGGDRGHAGHFFNYPDGHTVDEDADDGDAGLEEERIASVGM